MRERLRMMRHMIPWIFADLDTIIDTYSEPKEVKDDS